MRSATGDWKEDKINVLDLLETAQGELDYKNINNTVKAMKEALHMLKAH